MLARQQEYCYWKRQSFCHTYLETNDGENHTRIVANGNTMPQVMTSPLLLEFDWYIRNSWNGRRWWRSEVATKLKFRLRRDILFDQEHGGRQRSNDNKIVKRRADDNGLANPLIFESVELDQLFNPMNVGQTHHGRSTKPKFFIQNEIQIKSIKWVKRNENKFIWRFLCNARTVRPN